MLEPTLSLICTRMYICMSERSTKDICLECMYYVVVLRTWPKLKYFTEVGARKSIGPRKPSLSTWAGSSRRVTRHSARPVGDALVIVLADHCSIYPASSSWEHPSMHQCTIITLSPSTFESVHFLNLASEPIMTRCLTPPFTLPSTVICLPIHS